MNDKKLNIVAIFAHPDDLAFSCAGTLARWAEERHQIHAICVTSGNVGTLRTDLTLNDVAQMRERELRASNEILGIKNTIMLGYPDGGFIDEKKLRKELVYHVRALKADRVVTFDPWQKYEVHPDHMIVGRMAAEAAAFGAFPLLYPDQLKEGTSPYSSSEVWFMGILGHAPNIYIDISSTFQKKVESALKFEATLTLLADLFAPNIDPANVSPKELKKLTNYAQRLLRSMAMAIGKKVNLEVAECFFMQKTLPGHFDNFQMLMSEMLGNPPEKPKVI
ncbi:MAG: PIG-L deacetylase family protein [Promethearchaeota archaeon]